MEKILSDRDLQFREVLVFLMKEKKMTSKDVATSIDRSRRLIDMVISGERGAGKVTTDRLTSLLKLTYEEMLDLGRWILLGKDGAEWPGINRGNIEATMPSLGFAGVMSSGKKVTGNFSTPYGDATPEEEAAYDPHFSPVRKAKAKLSAGNGNFVLDEGWTGLYHFRTDWLNYICGVNNAVLFDVDGESMEPTVKDKDTVLIDRSRVEFANEKIFAIGIEKTILIKRLRMNVSGKIKVVSDNPDKSRFPDEEIDSSEIRILGLVVWRGGVV